MHSNFDESEFEFESGNETKSTNPTNSVKSMPKKQKMLVSETSIEFEEKFLKMEKEMMYWKNEGAKLEKMRIEGENREKQIEIAKKQIEIEKEKIEKEMKKMKIKMVEIERRMEEERDGRRKMEEEIVPKLIGRIEKKRMKLKKLKKLRDEVDLVEMKKKEAERKKILRKNGVEILKKLKLLQRDKSDLLNLGRELQVNMNSLTNETATKLNKKIWEVALVAEKELENQVNQKLHYRGLLEEKNSLNVFVDSYKPGMFSKEGCLSMVNDTKCSIQ